MRDEQFALDAVQDAMTKLVEKYSAHPAAELPLLFQRILQNTVLDHFRRQKVRALWTPPMSAFSASDDEGEHDTLDILSLHAGNAETSPSEHAEQSQMLEIIEQALTELPARQRQAFLLRYWEEMDVAQTAIAMGCSEGSVKTHCSRATHALAALLKAKGISS